MREPNGVTVEMMQVQNKKLMCIQNIGISSQKLPWDIHNGLLLG